MAGENNFCGKSPVDSTDILRVKNFFEIALSCTVSEIMRFCILRRNSRWPPKTAGNRFLGKVASKTHDSLRVKNFVKITLSRTISEILKIFIFSIMKIVVFSLSLISRLFCIGSLPKVNDIYIMNLLDKFHVNR